VNHRLLGTMSGLALVSMLGACERELILPGERFAVRTDLQASVPVEGEADPVAPPIRAENRAEPISIPAAQTLSAWTDRGGNVRHASGNATLSAAPQHVWTVNIGQGDSRKNRLSASPVVADGRVYTMDSEALVQATSTAGAVIWQANLTATFDRGGDVSGGGIAYAGGMVYAATGYGELVALDGATGAVAWRQRLDSPVTGAPAVDGGIVYVVGRDGSAWAVKSDTGRVLWTAPGAVGATGMVGGAAPAVGDRAVIFPFASGGLTALLRQSGLRVWDAPVTGQRLGRGYSGITDITGDPVIVGPVTYVGTASGRTAALKTASGERIWTADEGAMNAPLVVGGSVFVVNDEAQLVRLDATTGEVVWAIDMPYFLKDKAKKRKAITAHFGPVLAGGHLIVVSDDGQMRIFNPEDGAMIGGAEIPGGAATAPALADGMLFVVSGNGQLHAFR
jgi:outer membrane protein assembly factor BamB